MNTTDEVDRGSMKPKKYTMVFAGSYREFMNYCRRRKINPRNKWEKIIYVTSPEQVMGLRDFEIVKYGTWYMNDWITSELLVGLEFQTTL